MLGCCGKRRRDTAATRSTRRATLSSLPSPMPARRSRRRWRRSGRCSASRGFMAVRCWSVWDCTLVPRRLSMPTMSGSTCIGRHESPAPPMVGRSWCLRRPIAPSTAPSMVWRFSTWVSTFSRTLTSPSTSVRCSPMVFGPSFHRYGRWSRRRTFPGGPGRWLVVDGSSPSFAGWFVMLRRGS